MVKKKIVKKTLIKKKKRWFKILPPDIFKKTELLEARATNINDLINRRIKISLANLTGESKKQNVEITLVINEIKEDKAHTNIIAYEIANSHIKRLVKKEKNIMNDSFIVKTKDNVNVKLKPFFLTKYKINKSIIKSLRKKSRVLLEEKVKKSNYDDLVNSLLNDSIKLTLKKELKKIYPLAVCEIRVFKRL